MATERKTTAAAPREYVVLARDPDPQESWNDVGRSTAATAKQAVAKLVETLPAAQQTGTFVAVPVRNWQPMTRKTETVTKATWS